MIQQVRFFNSMKDRGGRGSCVDSSYVARSNGTGELYMYEE